MTDEPTPRVNIGTPPPPIGHETVFRGTGPDHTSIVSGGRLHDNGGRYRLGHNPPGVFDCSDLVAWVHRTDEQRRVHAAAALRRARRRDLLELLRHPIVVVRRRIVDWAWNRWGSEG